MRECVCSDRDNAGVPRSPFRRREDQNVSGCPLTVVVRFHKDISMSFRLAYLEISSILTLNLSFATDR